MQRLHVKWYHCEIERSQSIFKAAGAPSRAVNLAPQVVQGCQVRRPRRRPGQSNKLIYLLALQFQEEVQFDLLFYHSALEPNLGGVQGISIIHSMGCCIRWFVCINVPSELTSDLPEAISIGWINVFGNMKTLTLDG